MNAIKDCKIQNITDGDENPAGGTVTGTGIRIEWQNGPLGRGTDRKVPNGAFVETVISAAIARITFYQASQFKCKENAQAFRHLNRALAILEERTANREAREVEGTHKV